MKIQNIKPSDGDTYIIENYDGELNLMIFPDEPLNNFTLKFPDNPPRASKIKIFSTQDIKKLNAIGSFKEPFSTMKAGDVGFVHCPIGKEYLITGKNEYVRIKVSLWEWIRSKFQKKISS